MHQNAAGVRNSLSHAHKVIRHTHATIIIIIGFAAAVAALLQRPAIVQSVAP